MILGVFATPGFAVKAGRIAGKVKASEGSGLLGAVVTVFNASGEGGTISFTRSDPSGGYAISNLTPGSYYVQVSREGYAPQTQANVKIDPGRTTTLDVILQSILELVGPDNDPRNWDFKTVLRSTSDRRLIFRHSAPDGAGSDMAVGRLPGGEKVGNPFTRSAAVNVTSSSGLSSDYAVYPTNGRNGLVSNFAFAEPVGDHGRMLFTGQLNSGYDSLWRVRNTYNYRPEPGNDVKLSVGYGRLSLNGLSFGNVSRPASFFSQDPILRESPVEMLGMSLEARSKILDPVSLEYGLDYSRLSYGATKSVFSPFFQVVVTPSETWTLKTAMASRRPSDSNSIVLADGDVLNLGDPTYVAQIDGEIRLSQFKHAEVSVAKELPDETSVEVAAYEDHMEGPGTPFAISERSPGRNVTRLAQLRQDQAAHHGVRVTVNRRFLDFLSGSIAYVYGTGTTLETNDSPLASDVLARDLVNYLHRSYYHALTSRVDARIPRTGTQVSTIVRWYPGITLSPIDLFYDRKDTLTKGVNLFVRQAIPLPEFMGTPGRWEALVDLRNLFDQGRGVLRTSDGELSLTRSPRSVRFGLNLNLF
jgi:hypothetical protein